MRNSSRSLRIFVVENHVDTLKYLRTYLGQLGYAVGSAETVLTARTQLTREPWDVLLSDIGLPDGTGWELLTSLGKERPRVCVAMSGYGMPTDVAQSAASGFDRHLIKPFPPEDLERILEEAEAARR